MPDSYTSPFAGEIDLSQYQSEGAPEQGGNQPGQQQPANQPAQQQEETFFDASKVPPQLQPSFREMQAAWTKKVEAAKEETKWLDAYGVSREQLRSFLDQINHPQGLRSWWEGIAQQYGLSPAQLQSMLNGGQPHGNQNGYQQPQPAQQQVQQQPQYQDPSQRPMTIAEFQAFQQQQQFAAQAAAEDREVETALKELKVPEAATQMVLGAAMAQPQWLGYTERIKRGLDQYNQMVNQALASSPKGPGAPKPMGGTIPNPTGPAPKNLDEAKAASKAMLRALSQE